MNKRFVRAALVACLLGSAAAMAITAPLSPAYAKSSQSVSAPVGKLLAPAQKLLAANDFAGAMALIKQAQALPDQTPFDTYSINNFLASAALGLKDYATADTAYEAMVDSGAIPDEEKASTLHNAVLLTDQFKHYDKTVKYGQALIALGGTPDATVISAMAQAFYFTNDFANAATYAQKALDATPAGQPPNRAALEIKFGAQLKSNQTDAAMATLEQVLAYYDDKDDWGQVIDVSIGTKGIQNIEALHIYRLREVTKANGQADAYLTAAGLALAKDLNYPVEADAILSAGVAAGVVNAGNPQVADARHRADQDRASIAQFDAVARKSPTGDFDLKLAETYMGYGRYADAEAAARRALQKGGAKMSANEANMVLGEALLLQGKTPDAVAAFNALSNPSPGWAKAQHLWLLYANRKYA